MTTSRQNQRLSEIAAKPTFRDIDGRERRVPQEFDLFAVGIVDRLVSGTD